MHFWKKEYDTLLSNLKNLIWKMKFLKRVKKFKWKKDNEIFKLLKDESEKLFWVFKNLKDNEVSLLDESIESWFWFGKKWRALYDFV